MFGPVGCNREAVFDARRSGLSRCQWNRCAAAKVFCQCAITSACNIRVAAIWQANAPRGGRGTEGLKLREPVSSRRICAVGPVIASIHATRAALQDAIRAMVPKGMGTATQATARSIITANRTTQAYRRNQQGCARSDGQLLRIPRALSSNRVTASPVRRRQPAKANRSCSLLFSQTSAGIGTVGSWSHLPPSHCAPYLSSHTSSMRQPL